MKKDECNYSDDENLEKAVKQIKQGKTYEDVQRQFNLTDNDIELIDFVMNEFNI